MELTNWFLPARTDRNVRQPNVNPRAWLLEVVIEELDRKKKDPSFYVRSLPRHHEDFQSWNLLRIVLMGIRIFIGDPVGLACEMATLDFMAFFHVIHRVEKNDNLHEVLARALRSIRQTLVNTGSYRDTLNIFKRNINGIVSKLGIEQEYLNDSESDSKLAIACTFHAFLTSVLHLLTSVFQYLIGYVDRGGSKTFSSGAFDFRASFVSLVLFQGAYVWIKFRQAARPGCRKRKAPDVEHEDVDIETANLKGVYARPIKEKSSGAITRFKYEPRFTPPRHEGDDGTDPCSKRLPLGEYHTRAEAQIVLQIARFYYDKDGGFVELQDGRYKFSIPPMSEQEQGLAGKEKRTWVSRRAKQLGKQMYADFRREKGKHLNIIRTEAGSHGAEATDPSSSAPPLPCSSLPVPAVVADEPAIASAAPSSPSLPLLPWDGATVGDAYDSCESLSGFEDMIAELFHDPGSPNLPDHQSSVVLYPMQFEGFAQLLGGPSLPEGGGVAGATELYSELELNRSPSFQEGKNLADAGTENMDASVFLPQSIPDLQQLLLCQKKWLEDSTRQLVHLDHQLQASEIQNSRLQQEKEQLRTENESLKSRLEQVAKAQVATWTGVMIDIRQRD